jgi:hemolysin activation/secretion protein
MKSMRGLKPALAAMLLLLGLPMPLHAATDVEASSSNDKKSPENNFKPFVLRELRLDGGDFKREEVIHLVQPLLDRLVSLEDIRTLAQGIAEAAQKKGIALPNVTVPDQNFAGGLLRIVVTPGAVQVRIDKNADDSLLRAYGRALSSERPLRLSTLQRYVSLIREMPGFNADIRLVETETGVAMDISGKRDRTALTVSAGNRGLALLGDTNFQADFMARGVATAGDEIGLTYARPLDNDRYSLLGLTYSLPVGTGGARLQGQVTRLRTYPDFYDLMGKATGFGVQINVPLVRSYTQLLVANIGVDGLDSDNALFGFNLLSEKVRAARFTVLYATATGRHEILASAAFSLGLPPLGARTSQPLASDPGFAKVVFRARMESRLTDRLRLRTSALVQASPDRLSGAEQMVLGGDEYGRGYPGSLLGGDSGYAGSAEIAWQPARKAKPGELELYAFVDGGKVRSKGRYAFPGYTQSLSSAGGGVRVLVRPRWSVDVGATARLTRVYGLEQPHWRAAFSTKFTL